MSSRFFQLQSEAAHGSRSSSRSSSPHHHHKSSSSHSSHSSHHSHRPQPQTTPNYAQRTSTSSDSSSGSSSYSSSYSSGYNYYDAAAQQQRYSMDQAQPRVEVMRCSRCAKCVETITSSARAADGDVRRVSTDDASASGMVRFGHNLYYCDRCARMVGYK